MLYLWSTKMTDSTNPLRQYFRQPAIYIKLPSQGKFWPEGSLSMPPNEELPVYPMTAVDEITSRTPDALFNGSAIIQIIQSCVPNIKNAWEMPAIDVDTLLVAVRLATYGHDMDINTKCPHCNVEHEYQLDLRTVLDNIKIPNYQEFLSTDGLEIVFRPISYKQLNSNGQLQFEDQRLMQMLNDSNVPDEEKMQQLGASFLRITELTIKSLAQSINYIKIPDQIVNDTGFIEEFLKNCDKSVFTKIRDHAVSLREQSEIKPLTIKCADCEKDFTQPFTLDMSNFFDSNF